MRVRRVLWPTDFSECASVALDHAVRMASWHRAALELLHVTVLGAEDPFRPPDHLPDREEVLRRVRRIPVRETVPIAGHGGEPIEVGRHQRRAHDAAAEILRFTTEKAVDLVVLGGHGQSGFRRSFLGSVAEEVVRLAPCPVLTVREPRDRRAGGPGGGSIVVPVDFSDHCATALRAARSLAVVHGSRLDLLYVVEPAIGPHTPETGGTSLARTAEQLAEFADEVLARPRIEHRIEVIEGIAAASITAYATGSQAELIVIATQGLTGQPHFLLDSVTEKVLRTAACPVLTIKGPRVPDAHEGAAAGLA